MFTPCSPLGLGAAEHQVVELGRVEAGDLVQRGPHHRGGEVVGADLLEGALEGAADGRAGVATMTASGMHASRATTSGGCRPIEPPLAGRRRAARPVSRRQVGVVLGGSLDVRAGWPRCRSSAHRPRGPRSGRPPAPRRPRCPPPRRPRPRPRDRAHALAAGGVGRLLAPAPANAEGRAHRGQQGRRRRRVAGDRGVEAVRPEHLARRGGELRPEHVAQRHRRPPASTTTIVWAAASWRLELRAIHRSGWATGSTVPRSGQVPTTTSAPASRSRRTASSR